MDNFLDTERPPLYLDELKVEPQSKSLLFKHVRNWLRVAENVATLPVEWQPAVPFLLAEWKQKTLGLTFSRVDHADMRDFNRACFLTGGIPSIALYDSHGLETRKVWNDVDRAHVGALARDAVSLYFVHIMMPKLIRQGVKPAQPITSLAPA